MPVKQMYLIVMMSLLSSCYNIQERVDVNVPIPEYWTARDYIRNPGIINTDIDNFIGRIAYQGKDGKFQTSQRIFKDSSPTLQVKTIASVYRYHSAVDKNWNLNAEIPGIAAVGSGSKFSFDYEIFDVANVILDDKYHPRRDSLKRKLESTIDTAIPLWYVYRVGLSEIRKKAFVENKDNSKLIGTVFNANGDLYNSESEAAYTPLVSIDVIPMNKAADSVFANLGYVKKTPINSNSLIEGSSDSTKTEKIIWRPVLSSKKGGAIEFVKTK